MTMKPQNENRRVARKFVARLVSYSAVSCGTTLAKVSSGTEESTAFVSGGSSSGSDSGSGDSTDSDSGSSSGSGSSGSSSSSGTKTCKLKKKSTAPANAKRNLAAYKPKHVSRIMKNLDLTSFYAAHH